MDTHACLRVYICIFIYVCIYICINYNPSKSYSVKFMIIMWCMFNRSKKNNSD